MTPPDLLIQPQSTHTETEPASFTEESKLDLSPKGVWQRQPNETPGSYTAFTTFLELGLDATLQQVADATGKKLPAILSLSARHHWMDRAAAWRSHVSHTYLADAQRERARQTELSQMRDRLLRQEMWEDHQTLRAFCREGLNKLRTDPANATLAGYEIKGLFDLYFKLGRAATAPTGFTFDGPAPASPEFDEAIKQTYGQPRSFDELLELLLLARPDQEDLIRSKFAAAGSPNPADTNSGGSNSGGTSSASPNNSGAPASTNNSDSNGNQPSEIQIPPESNDPESAESSGSNRNSKIVENRKSTDPESSSGGSADSNRKSKTEDSADHPLMDVDQHSKLENPNVPGSDPFGEPTQHMHACAAAEIGNPIREIREIRGSQVPNHKFPHGVPFGHSLVEHVKSMARLGVPVDAETLKIAAEIARASGTPLHLESPIEAQNSSDSDSDPSVDFNQKSEFKNQKSKELFLRHPSGVAPVGPVFPPPKPAAIPGPISASPNHGPNQNLE